MDLMKKLTSRKLWAAIAGVVTGIAVIFGVEGTEITDIAGAITALVSIVSYIMAEGKIDAAAVKGVKTDAESN